MYVCMDGWMDGWMACVDLAVGAPLEGAGAVYIYRGCAGRTMTSRYSQRISARDVPRAGAALSHFGHALARTPAGLDLDDSTYPDVIVGQPRVTSTAQTGLSFLGSRRTIQTRNYNFFAPPPGKHSLRSLVLVLIHNSGHFGPLYRFGPLPPGIAVAADG